MEIKNKAVPYLVNLSVGRTGNDRLPGYYDNKQDVWVIEKNGVSKPIIEVSKSVTELQTKTLENRESDDENYSALLEMSTKTDVKPERDDFIDVDFMNMLELITKTSARLESDD